MQMLARESGPGGTGAEVHCVDITKKPFLQVEHCFGAAAGDGEFEFPLHSKAETHAHREKKSYVILFSGKNHIWSILLCTSY